MSDLHALPHAGRYRVVYADPAWRFVTRSLKGEGRSPQRHYSTMTLDEICALDVAEICAENCHLFLWSTGPHLQSAFRVMRSWGFAYSGMGFVWVKMKGVNGRLFVEEADAHVGMGYTTRKNSEFCLLGKRGAPQRLRKDVRELVMAPRRQHSRKPDEVALRIINYAAGPRLEMFARQRREGFDAWGLEVERFG